MELQCKVQHYDWGKLGKESTVAKLIAGANKNIVIDEERPYAELWMGTHPSGPSLIVERGILLSDYLKDNVDAVGPDVIKHFGVTVPFLLKVLSIRKALSIQAHPNKEHAEILHRDFPNLYKDPNHKPELAIPLTPFEALCGFRPVEEIKYFLSNIPELRAVLTEEQVKEVQNESSRDIAKVVFSALMTSVKTTIASSIENLLQRLKDADKDVQSKQLYHLVQRLAGDFPGDVGCLSVYLLNYLTLRPGQAIFLAANLPHAYLSGDCVECMACSDNVVRAGLTPKHMDVPTLLSMLDYSSFTPDQLLFTPELEDEFSCVWRPPPPDFAVVKITVPSGSTYNTRNRPSPSILLVTSGSGTAQDTEPITVAMGSVLFLKASRQLTLTAKETLVVYQAVANIS